VSFTIKQLAASYIVPSAANALTAAHVVNVQWRLALSVMSIALRDERKEGRRAKSNPPRH
jgi:hypothetical protein